MSGLMVSNAVARLRYIIKNLLVPPIDTSKVGQKLKLIVISNLPVILCGAYMTYLQVYCRTEQYTDRIT